jgi:flagellar hook-length control protein FliK
MNLSAIQTITTPASAPILQGQSVETLLDFDALVGQATNPIVKDADPKTGSAAPIESPEAPAVTAAPVTREIPTSPSPTVQFNTTDQLFKGEPPQQDRTPGSTAIVVADANHAHGAKPVAAPVADRELNLRFSPDMGKRSMVDSPIVAEAENAQAESAIKVDTQLPKAVPDQTAQPPVTPPKAVLISYSEEEPNDKDEAPARDLPDVPVQIAMPTPPPPPLIVAAATAAPVQSTMLATPRSDAPKDIRKATMPVDKGTDKIPFSAAELPLKIPTSEPTVTQFSLPTAAPQGVAPAAMTAPLFATPDMSTSHQLDLARDTQWIEQLTREIVSVAGQDGKLRFGLAPDGLGHLEVMVETQKDGVNIQFQTSTENAAKIFAAEQPKLLEELRQSGVRVANSDLMAGHQMQSQRDHSRAQNLAWQGPSNPQSNQPNNRPPSAHPNTSLSGRFA